MFTALSHTTTNPTILVSIWYHQFKRKSFSRPTLIQASLLQRINNLSLQSFKPMQSHIRSFNKHRLSRNQLVLLYYVTFHCSPWDRGVGGLTPK